MCNNSIISVWCITISMDMRIVVSMWNHLLKIYKGFRVLLNSHCDVFGSWFFLVALANDRRVSSANNKSVCTRNNQRYSNIVFDEVGYSSGCIVCITCRATSCAFGEDIKFPSKSEDCWLAMARDADRVQRSVMAFAAVLREETAAGISRRAD